MSQGDTFKDGDVFYVLVEEVVGEHGYIERVKVCGIVSDGRWADAWDEGRHRKHYTGSLEELNKEGFPSSADEPEDD